MVTILQQDHSFVEDTKNDVMLFKLICLHD